MTSRRMMNFAYYDGYHTPDAPPTTTTARTREPVLRYNYSGRPPPTGTTLFRPEQVYVYSSTCSTRSPYEGHSRSSRTTGPALPVLADDARIDVIRKVSPRAPQRTKIDAEVPDGRAAGSTSDHRRAGPRIHPYTTAGISSSTRQLGDVPFDVAMISRLHLASCIAVKVTVPCGAE